MSMTPIMVSLSMLGFRFVFLPSLRLMKFQDDVVWSFIFLLGNTDTTFSIPKNKHYRTLKDEKHKTWNFLLQILDFISIKYVCVLLEIN